MIKINSINAEEVKDSRGELTLGANIKTGEGSFFSSVPSGASVGKYEAKPLDVKKAEEKIDDFISEKLRGKEFEDIKEFDKFLLDLDGTEDKSNLGANSTLALSLAACRAFSYSLPLYKYINEVFKIKEIKMPTPCFNILNGGAHAKNDLSVQEFMVVPKGDSFKDKFRKGLNLYHSLEERLKERFEDLNMGDEGGFAPLITKTKKGLDLIMRTIKKEDLSDEVELGLDCAASEFFEDGEYLFEEDKIKGEKLMKRYQELIESYPIVFLEDPFSQNDWKNWTSFSKQTSVTLIGDDLLATNSKRIKEAKEKKACNGMILKPNQIGTITEAVQAGLLGQSYGWDLIVSHRSGETEDNFIADLSCGLAAEYIKSGAPGPKERMSKYNRLLEIEKQLNDEE